MIKIQFFFRTHSCTKPQKTKHETTAKKNQHKRKQLFEKIAKKRECSTELECCLILICINFLFHFLQHLLRLIEFSIKIIELFHPEGGGGGSWLINENARPRNDSLKSDRLIDKQPFSWFSFWLNKATLKIFYYWWDSYRF